MAKQFNNGDEICNHNFDGGLCKKCLAPETRADQLKSSPIATYRATAPHSTMKITNLEFSLIEAATLKLRAVSALVERGLSKKEARERVSADTPQNVLRLALGFERRTRGGARPNTGRRYGKEKAA